MVTIDRLAFAFAVLLAPIVLAAPAGATTLSHTWVSNGGNDDASCEITAPCLTFNGAYGKTTSGGEITCLNGGDYLSGNLLINNSVTIDCQYSIGSSLALSEGAVIAINAPAGSVVTLRGLDMDNGTSDVLCLGSGGAINFSGGGVLHLQKMKINHGPSCINGVLFAPTATATLDVTDSDITDNGTISNIAGIYIQPQSGVQANVTITRTQVQGNFYGIFADGTQGGTIRGTISDSVVSGSTENGVTALSAGASVVLIIDQTKIAGNDAAGLVASGSNAALLVRYSTVFGNAIGLRPVNGGAIYSYGTNSVAGNPTEGSFTGAAGLQ